MLTDLCQIILKDSGERRVVPAKLEEAIEGLALQKPPLPIRNLPADLVTLAHDGAKAYSNTFELVHRREASGPNAIWQADHTPLDILLLRPDGETAKPWLSVAIDGYSRATTEYFLSFEDQSALHPSLALRQATWRSEDARWIACGIPNIWSRSAQA